MWYYFHIFLLPLPPSYYTYGIGMLLLDSHNIVDCEIF